MARDAEAAALAAATKLMVEEEEKTEETEETQETPEGEASQETEEEPLFPEFEIELPEDLEAELAAPTDEEIEAELEEDEEYQELDEEGRRLLSRAKAAEREVATIRAQRAKNDRVKWEEEAKKFFPLSEHALTTIKAESRRGFLRQAKNEHEKVLPFVKKVQEQYKEAQDKEIERVKAEARAEAEKQWGRPATEGAPPTEATITQEQLDRNRAKGDFAATVKSMIFPTRKES